MSKWFRLGCAALGSLWVLGLYSARVTTQSSVTEAPTGFDSLTNGFVDQPTFDNDRVTFEERDDISKGLGPVFNAQSCAECHQTPVTGGISQITELRAGHFDGVNFVDAAGGSLINDRSTSPEIQEHVPTGNEVRTFRTSLNTLGDGFVEAIDDDTLLAIANGQPAAIRGRAVMVPVAEGNSGLRVGRFGWKNQQASLLSFASDAYLNEQGITNRFNLVENTSNGRFIGFGSGFDPVPDTAPFGEDADDDIDAFADFMRATKAPARGPITPSVNAGGTLFNLIGCGTCHVPNIVTAPAGTVINGGALTVSPALGNKVIHPFSDFLLHNIGTGDGIVQNGGQSTRLQMRTAPLWGVRTRSRLMHDGLSLTFTDAINRHEGQATFSRLLFNVLATAQKNQLLAFLGSL
ncbi:MAG TPA: di-heme oxidoredictase family protein [Vicinamibacterales bacterium]|nr:di-heme oxidoredictase family protein [Vicinamibacterales bacterium]